MSWIDGDLTMRQKVYRHYRKRVRDPKYNLSLLRTPTALILELPRSGIRKGWAGWIRGHLPAFKFNARRGWWEAPLTVENHSRVAEVFQMACRELNVSDGIKEWIETRRQG